MAKQRELASVSPAETEILRIVWERGEATVGEVVDGLPSERDITYATVQTLLRRLEKKGYLKHEVRGKAHVFSAAAHKEEVISRTVKDFLDRLFGGDPVPLVHHLARHGKLDAADIERLKKLVDDK